MFFSCSLIKCHPSLESGKQAVAKPFIVDE